MDFAETAGTSSRLRPLQRPRFSELFAYARSGDTVQISEMSRAVRGTRHLLGVCTQLPRPAHPRRRVLRHGPHRPPPAYRRTAVHGQAHGSDSCNAHTR
ncbi:hypothetical protein [Streptomyces gardneri]|uniref:hypothetical protein n=1 Tax=Streptomyces gardneri TaxID=66892 RepID=UPI0033D8237C